MRIFFAIAAVLGAAGVAAGAFGAHWIGDHPGFSEKALATWETGARYQMFHALALLASAAWFQNGESVDLGFGAVTFSLWAFVAGTIVFSGSLYALVLTDTKWLGAITPIGGLALIAGWVGLLVATVTG